MSKIVRSSLAVPALALVLLGVTACGGSPSTTVSAVSTHASAAVSQSSAEPAASTTSSSSAATPSKASPSASERASRALVKVRGYHYVALPTELKPISTSLTDSGLITAVSARGVAKGSHTDPDLAIFLASYNPKLTVRLDKAPITKVLDGASKGFRAFADAHATTSDHVLSGKHVRLIVSSQVSIAVGYERGGTLVEIIGPKSAETLRFARAYFAAGG